MIAGNLHAEAKRVPQQDGFGVLVDALVLDYCNHISGQHFGDPHALLLLWNHFNVIKISFNSKREFVPADQRSAENHRWQQIRSSDIRDIRHRWSVRRSEWNRCRELGKKQRLAGEAERWTQAVASSRQVGEERKHSGRCCCIADSAQCC